MFYSCSVFHCLTILLGICLHNFSIIENTVMATLMLKYTYAYALSILLAEDEFLVMELPGMSLYFLRPLVHIHVEAALTSSSYSSEIPQILASLFITFYIEKKWEVTQDVGSQLGKEWTCPKSNLLKSLCLFKNLNHFFSQRYHPRMVSDSNTTSSDARQSISVMGCPVLFSAFCMNWRSCLVRVRSSLLKLWCHLIHLGNAGVPVGNLRASGGHYY